MSRTHFIQASADRVPMGDRSVDLTLCSPPYIDARTYGIAAQRKCDQWIEWMLIVLAELQRVTIGPVVVVAAGGHRKRNYQPACEGLMYLWWKRGGECQLYRPVYWHRVGIPGSGGTDWFRADVEYCMCFKRPGELPFSDNTACGHPPKWAPGGEMSNRLSSGARVNQWGHPIDSGGTTGSVDDVTCGAARPSHRQALGFDSGYVRTRPGHGRIKIEDGEVEQNGKSVAKCGGGSRRANGKYKEGGYDMPTLANPGNLFKCIVGGGVMGHPIAHENEAPYPEKLCEFFIKSLCPPGGIVFDPFSGSGTTACTAARLGRIGIGADLRMSQCELGKRRWNEPVKPKKSRPAAKHGESLFDEVAA